MKIVVLLNILFYNYYESGLKKNTIKNNDFSAYY